ncbi:MAG: hypothetical protein JXA15_12525 [Spirochaetales bacterium]|nr:hypothetical protein [Spirochaetales bacterium]
MMTTTDLVLDALRSLHGASAWKLESLRSLRHERYYVGKAQETARAVEKLDCEATVYVDSGEGEARTRGECAVKLADGASGAEIGAALSRALVAAAGARNPWFPLAEPSGAGRSLEASGFEALEPGAALEGLRSALYRHDGEGGAAINSLELFLSRKERRVVNSAGVDVSWTSWAGHLEFVVNAGAGHEQVELWTERAFAEPDAEGLAALVRDRLAAVRDRLSAMPTPDCAGLPLVLSGELAGEVYSYFQANLSAQAAYEKRAAFGVGDDTGAPGDGDAIEFTALGALRHAVGGAPYDQDGYPLGELRCVEAGRVKTLIAPLRYARYLGMAPSGALGLFTLAGGRSTAAELRAADHLEVVDFSDFFVNPTGGEFGGEIRLGFLVRDGRRVAVTGGSVTGSMVANRGRLRLSRELGEKARSLSPELCVLPVVSVAAAG